MVAGLANAMGLPAWRYAEGGSKDVGDVAVQADTEWALECKSRERLNVHTTLARTLDKANGRPAAVVWKRLALKPGNRRRSADGVGIVVCLTLDDYLTLLQKATWFTQIVGELGAHESH